MELVITDIEQSSKGHEDYQVALLTFVNSIIQSAGCLQDRIRLRNEFYGNSLQIIIVHKNIVNIYFLQV